MIIPTTIPPVATPGWTVASVGPRGVTAELRTMTSPAGRSVVVARFPAQSTALHLHLGSEDPPGGLSEVPPDASNAVATTNAESSLLVAGFNGGFKADAGAGGVEADGTTVRPLIPGVASALIDARGLLTIGAWGAVSLPTGDRLVSVRQNLSLLVDGGRPTATALSGPGPWGSVLGPDPVVARSALGVDAEGNAYFAGSMHVLPADLAQVLSSIGVVRAMQLDMNPYWVTLGTTPTPGGTLTSQIPGETNPATIFVSGWTRDFFTVMARPPRSCHLRFPGPPEVPGPAAATVVCGPQHLATPALPAMTWP
ncbi:MAG: hypothetical protein WCG96_03340 [Actinomycetes bacterium]